MFLQKKSVLGCALALSALAPRAAAMTFPSEGLAEGESITLGPANDLAKGLNAILPTVQKNTGFYTLTKQVALEDAYGQTLLVTCQTSQMPTRAPWPIEHFLGCTVLATDDVDFSAAHWSLTDLFLKAAAAVPTTAQEFHPACNPHSRAGC